MTIASDAMAVAADSGLPSGLCVLVVEDDEADIYLISRALAGHPSIGDVVYASDGAQALDMVDRGVVDPDVAFIDLHMPRKNGFSLLTAFACDPKQNFPMVVLTSSVAPTDAIRSRLRGAIRVVTKPDSVEAMSAALSSAIGAVCARRPSRPTAKPASARFAPPGAGAATPRFSFSARRSVIKNTPDAGEEDQSADHS